ncbi:MULTISPECIES: GFA family protein [Rhizobium]|uniref:GFA family protein n=1 Tax=Rhizobium sp. 60-20 TaxID=1895819 RepID=UPI0009DFE2B8
MANKLDRSKERARQQSPAHRAQSARRSRFSIVRFPDAQSTSQAGTTALDRICDRENFLAGREARRSRSVLSGVGNDVQSSAQPIHPLEHFKRNKSELLLSPRNRVTEVSSRTKSWSGGCVCGSVRYTCVGDQQRVTVCHCLWCQRRTGSRSGVEALLQEGNIEFSGIEPARYRHLSDESGRWLDDYFCPRCGSNLGLTPQAVAGYPDRACRHARRFRFTRFKADELSSPIHALSTE